MDPESSGDLAKAEQLVTWFRDSLEPESFYLEIMDHGIDKQKQVTQALLELNKRTGIRSEEHTSELQSH